MNTLELPAPGKLNLFLHINEQREDGHHELQTIFQFIDTCDTLQLTERADSKIHVNTKIPGIADKNNLVLRAAKMIQGYDKKRRGVDINLEKKLPIGGGLGGGSSDAATTLLGLNMLWDMQLPIEQLLQMGLQLGADVPVFILGKACWAEGIGEKLTPMNLPQPWYLVLVPPVSISTAEVFFDKNLTRNTARCEPSVELLQTGANDCQRVVVDKYPEVASALNWLNQYATAQMTGTGACLFARFKKVQDAQAVLAEMPPEYKGFITQGLNTSPLLTKLRSHR
jgi:4-diphosphocytidyl-2-C-methyl-D-erythritol kinase